jgi:FtsP/CotA-like multicopper oxidase with cupredoxin domain
MNEMTIQTTPASRREGTVMGIKGNRKRLVAAAIAIAGLAGGAAAVHASTFGEVATATGVPTFPTITPTCTADCPIALDAGTGSVTVADAVNGSQVVPFYGFNVGGANAGAHTLAGGATSTIKVPQGTTLTITLTQSGVGGAIDLSFPSLPANDVTHVGNVYTVKASKVGTSVFQPGSNADAPKQVAMGLVGVLIVTPPGCTSLTLSCAYDGAVSYTDEALVATTDLDAEFAANPSAFDMGYFGQSPNPDGSARKVYHVVNGQSFPDTQMIDVRATDSLLIRSVNAGVSDKSMSLLGLRQTLLARNSSPYVDAQTFIAPLVGPGETADLVVGIPGTAVVGQQYALIDAGRQMNHGNAYGFGGALTFLTVWPA